jgi:hypothetical protein
MIGKVARRSLSDWSRKFATQCVLNLGCERKGTPHRLLGYAERPQLPVVRVVIFADTDKRGDQSVTSRAPRSLLK